MGKTRHLFKKIGDTKGTFHAKIGSVKDTNGMDLTEASRGGKNTQKNSTKKGLNNSNNHDGVVTIDILGCEVKLA